MNETDTKRTPHTNRLASAIGAALVVDARVAAAPRETRFAVRTQIRAGLCGQNGCK